MDVQFCEECAAMDDDVDREIARSNNNNGTNALKKKKRKPAAPRGRRGRGRQRGRGRGGAAAAAPPPESEEEEEEEAEEAAEDEEEPPARIRPFALMGLEDTEVRGVPAAMVAMRVVVRPAVELSMRITEMRLHLRSLPESVMIDLLRAHMLTEQGGEEDDHLLQRMRERALRVSASEMREIVIGDGEYSLTRPMLAHGDAVWGEQMMHTVHGTAAAPRRLTALRQFLHMGFALAYTRSRGSDGYNNDRVASFGRSMLFDGGVQSRRECRDAYTRMRLATAEASGSASVEALRFLLDTFVQCDQHAWNLRPDNMHLVMQLLISDVMLCLNYHGSVIEGAHNGIGATLIVRDGYGNYRRWFKDVSGGGGTVLGQVMDKNNGTGADFCVAALKKVTTIGKYDPRFAMRRELMVEMKRVTETSLMHETCDTIEHRGNTSTIKHRIEETGERKYTTELKARGDQQSINNMQAISWLIARNTQAMDFNRFTTTREDPASKERVLVEYRQVIGGYLCLCSNSVGENVRERYHTLLAVCRCVASGAEGVDLSEVLRRAQSERAFVQSVQSEERFNAQNGSLNRTVMSAKDDGLFTRGRPVFFAGLGTTVFAGFMQWTGMLDRIHETRLAHAMLQIFYAQVFFFFFCFVGVSVLRDACRLAYARAS